MNDPATTSIKAGVTPLIDVTFLLLVFFIAGIQPAEGQLEAFLPKAADGRETGHCRLLSEVRIKLLWYDRAGNPTTADEGTVILKVGRKVYNAPGELDINMEEHPAWRRLYKDLLAYKRGARPGPVEDFIIDAREQVPHRYVVRVLNELIRAGIDEVIFAAPEKKY